MRFDLRCPLPALVIAAGVLSGDAFLMVPCPAHADYTVEWWTNFGVVDSPDSGGAPPPVVFLTTDKLTEAGQGTSQIKVKHQGQHTHLVSTGGRLYRAKTKAHGELSIYCEEEGTLQAGTPPGWAWVIVTSPDPMSWQAYGPELELTNEEGTTAHTQARAVYFVEGSQGGGQEVTKDDEEWTVVCP